VANSILWPQHITSHRSGKNRKKNYNREPGFGHILFFVCEFVCRAQANIPNRQISRGAFFTVRGSFPFRAFVSILAVHLCGSGSQDEDAACVTGKALLVTQNGHQSG